MVRAPILSPSLVLLLANCLIGCAGDPSGSILPPHPLETEETSIFTLVLDDEGGLAPASGQPYLLEMFLPTGGTAEGISANFSDIRFDLAGVDDEAERGRVGLAAQRSAEDFAAIVVVDSSRYSWFYVDTDRYVFPPGTVEIAPGGPFITLVFHDDSDEPLSSSWVAGIAGLAPGGSIEEKPLSEGGELQVAGVSRRPLKWYLRPSRGEGEYSGEVYPRFQGAVPDLVIYKIWKASSERYRIRD